jgi:hypothetical protein
VKKIWASLFDFARVRRAGRHDGNLRAGQFSDDFRFGPWASLVKRH